MAALKILLWNMNGLNSPKKWKQIYHWIKKQKRDVIGLQETHIKKTETKYIINNSLGEEFHSLIEKKREGL